jgi:hypothetical protein
MCLHDFTHIVILVVTVLYNRKGTTSRVVHYINPRIGCLSRVHTKRTTCNLQKSYYKFHIHYVVSLHGTDYNVSHPNKLRVIRINLYTYKLHCVTNVYGL